MVFPNMILDYSHLIRKMLEKNVGSYFLSYSLYSLRLEFCELTIGAALSTINDIETKIR